MHQQYSPPTTPTPPSPALQQQQPTIKNEALPKLRLNSMLASDPALQPEAKAIKEMHPASSISEKDDKNNVDIEDVNPIKINDIVPVPSVIHPAVELMQRVPGFMCGPCGIKFSSISTLEAHQTYYCSHR